MNRSVAFDKLGGLYVYQDTLDFLQKAYSETIEGFAKGLGNKFIVSGLTVAGGNISDGFIVVNGELLPFIGGAPLAYVKIETIVTKEQFDDGALKDTYTIRRAKMVALPGADIFPYSDLQRLPIEGSSIFDSLDKYYQMLNSMIGLEPAVIINGCAVSNVNVGASTLDISAGMVMFNGKLKVNGTYSGAYPVHLTEVGGWYVGAPPVTGAYVTFDPNTSQRYVDVLNRALTKAGKIEMYETLSDRFVAGVGRWEMKGFELMTGMQGRVPVGLWWDGVAVANVTDAAYVAAGATGGENKHELTIAEMPAHTHTFPRFTDIGSDSGNAGADGADLQERTGETLSKGGGEAHENRQPFKIVVYVKRTA
jgi:hypothetical protein